MYLTVQQLYDKYYGKKDKYLVIDNQGTGFGEGIWNKNDLYRWSYYMDIDNEIEVGSFKSYMKKSLSDIADFRDITIVNLKNGKIYLPFATIGSVIFNDGDNFYKVNIDGEFYSSKTR